MNFKFGQWQGTIARRTCWYRNLSYGLFLEIWGLRSGENLAPPILGAFWSKFASLRPKINIWAYILQTANWILLIFGSPDVFRLRKEPINSLSFVRPSIRAFRSYNLDRSIFFFDFLHEVVSPYDLDDHQKIFGRKKFWPPKWPKMVKIWPFLAKIAIFECFWPISSKRRYKFS